MSKTYRRATSAQREGWDLAQYAIKQNRFTLMTRFNELVGSPSYAMTVVQDEFIDGRMGPDEMIDYARACREIIFSIEITCHPGSPQPDTDLT